MQKRYDDLLNTRLESVLDAGTVLILWTELYRWYETKKIAVNVYRDLNARWADIKDAKGETALGNLKGIEGSGGIWLFSDKNSFSVKERATKDE